MDSLAEPQGETVPRSLDSPGRRRTWLLFALALVAAAGIVFEGAFAPTRGLVRESGKEDKVACSIPEWRWALVDGSSYRYSDVLASSDWLRLEGVIWQGGRGAEAADRAGGSERQERWRIVHQGAVLVEANGEVVFRAGAATPLSPDLRMGIHVDEFDVTWEGEVLPFVLQVNGGLQRIQRNGRLEVELQRLDAFGRWAPLPVRHLYPDVPSPGTVRAARVTWWMGRAMRVLALLLIAGWALPRAWRGIRTRPGLWGLGLVAGSLTLAVRMVFLIQRMATDPSAWGLSVQSDNYLMFARSALSGDALPQGSMFSPGNTWWLMLLSAELGGGIWTLYVANVVVASLGAAAVAVAAYRLFGTAAGWITSLVVALYPPLVFYQSTLQIASAGSTLLMFVALSVAWLSERGGRRNAFVAGLLIGVSALIRPTVLVFVPVLAFACLLRSSGFVRRLTMAFAVVLGAAAAVLPQTLLNIQSGRPVLVADNGPLNFIIGNNRDATGEYGLPDAYSEARFWILNSDATFKDYVLRELATEPAHLAQLQLRKFGRFMAQEEGRNVLSFERQGLTHSGLLRALWVKGWFSMPLLCWLALTGLIRAFGSRPVRPPGGRALGILMGFYVAATVVAFVNGRIRLPAVALMLPFVGFGLRETVAALLKPSRRLLAPLAAAVVVAGGIWCSTNLPLERFESRVPDSSVPLDLDLGHGLGIAGFEEINSLRKAGGFVYVRLYWSLPEAVDEDLEVLVTIHDRSTGQVVAKRPLKVGSVSPPTLGTSTWPAGSLVPETLYFRVTRIMPADAELRVAPVRDGEAGAAVKVAELQLLEAVD